MAEKKKLKLPIIVSPIGIAKYAWLDKPDPYNTDKGGKPEFKVRLLLDDNDETRAWCQNVIDTGIAFAKENGIKLKKGFHNPFLFPEDHDEDDFIPQDGKERPKYDEDHRGRIIFNAKSGFKPGLIDSARNELPEDVKVMSGDRIRIKVQINPYEGVGSGISLRLSVAQLIEKRTSFAGGVNTDGFDDVEGGYVAGGQSRPDEDDEDF